MSLPNRTFNYNITNTAGNINIQNGTFGSIVASTGITTGGLSATTITGGNLSLSGNLNIAGTLTAVNITATNLVDTNISTGTLSATGLSILTNVISTNTSTGTLNASNGITTPSLSATNITGANLSLSGGVTCATLNVNTLFTNMSGATAVFTNISAGGIRITSGGLQLPTGTSSLVWRNTAGTEVAKIYDDSQLHVWTDDSMYFDIGGSVTSSNTRMFMNGTGVGIQTTTPRTALDVNGNLIINNTMFFSGTYGQANNGPRITENWGVTLVANGTDQPVRVSSGPLLVGYGGNGANFGTNANLLVSSNVGIGTTTASYRVTINTTGDTPAMNPDAYNSLIVAEDMSGAAARSGTLTGSAIYNQNTGGTTGYVQLTDAASTQNGQYYWNFNPGNAFTADWEAQTTGAGEDFLFFWGATSAPPTDAGSGARGNSSYSIEFDHANDTIRLYYDSTQLTAVAQAMGNSTSWFKCRVVYQRNTIRVYYNGSLIINYKDTARNLNLLNSFTGFTAWTSTTTSAHRIRDIRIQKFTEGLWSYQSQTSANITYYGGNVGISTTNPSYTLDVNGTIRASQGLTVGYSANNGISLGGGFIATNKLIETVWTGSVDQTNIYTPGHNSATAKLTLQGNNLVGINTTSPSYTLDVNSGSTAFAIRAIGSNVDSSVIRFENTSGSGGTFHVGSTATGSAAGRGFSFYDVTNSALRMIIASTGNIGIGTATPAYPLDIVSNTIGTIRATYSGMAAGVNDIIMFGQGASNNNYGIIDFNYITTGNSSNSIGLGFFGGNNKLVVNANGRVGINTTNPSHSLHVVSGAATDAMTVENTNANGFASIIYKTPSSSTIFSTGVGGASSGINYSDKWYVSCSGANFGVPSLTITTNGNFGVGTFFPNAPLHVAQNVSRDNGPYAFYSSSGSGTSSGSVSTSIYAAERVVAKEFNAFSDQRIKKDIVDVSDSSALSILRQIEPKQYKYRDVASRGTQPVWGFIAQQVRSVLDYATDLRTDFLPNIYEVADVTNTHTVTLSTATTTDLSPDQRIRLITSDDKFVETKITSIVDTHTFTVEDVLATDKVFVFGSEVEDFHTLNKDAIFTIATAALQEVDREMQAENEKLSTLEQFIQSKFPGEYTP